MTKNEKITVNNLIIQAKGNLVSDMNGEKVMLSVQNGKYYNLGEIGGRIWELIETSKMVSQVITTLTSEFDVEQAECEDQVISFLEHLLKEGLIQTDE